MTDFAFLHGGGQGSWVWDETIAALKAQAAPEKHRFLALDAPGCGAKRGRDTSALAFAGITTELVEDIEAADMKDVVLVGHSQAGTSLPAMAAARPGLFSRLIYVSCIAPDPGLTVQAMTATRIHGQGEGDGGRAFSDPGMSMAERYGLMFCNDMAPAQADAFIAKLGKDGWPPCCYVQCEWHYDHLVEFPTSYVLCLEDAILPLDWQERFAERFHADRLVRIDAGHQVMNTRPQALAEVLLAEARLAG